MPNTEMSVRSSMAGALRAVAVIGLIVGAAVPVQAGDNPFPWLEGSPVNFSKKAGIFSSTLPKGPTVARAASVETDFGVVLAEDVTDAVAEKLKAFINTGKPLLIECRTAGASCIQAVEDAGLKIIGGAPKNAEGLLIEKTSLNPIAVKPGRYKGTEYYVSFKSLFSRS